MSLNMSNTLLISTLLQKHCNKKQETQKCILKLCGWKYPQGTYTPQVGIEKSAGFFTVNRCQNTLYRGQLIVKGMKYEHLRNVHVSDFLQTSM